MYAALFIVFISAVTVVLMYTKSTFLKSFALLISVILATTASLAYFEILSGLFIKDKSSYMPWIQPVCFILLFIIVLAVLQTVAMKLIFVPVKFAKMPDKVGSAACGLVAGILISAAVLIAAEISPLDSKWPYERFDKNSPNPDNPKKVLLNADGFSVGWFNLLSSGSFSGKRSFKVMHSSFIDHSFLNRIGTDKVSVITEKNPIEVPSKKGLWYPQTDLKNSAEPNQPMQPSSSYDFMIVRIGFKKRALAKTKMTFSQLRLVCKPKNSADNFSGAAENVYPIGYMQSEDTVKIRNLNDIFTLQLTDFAEDENIKWIDFVFEVPNNSVPILAGFKQNNIVRLSAIASADQIPEPAPFKLIEPLEEDSKK